MDSLHNSSSDQAILGQTTTTPPTTTVIRPQTPPCKPQTTTAPPKPHSHSTPSAVSTPQRKVQPSRTVSQSTQSTVSPTNTTSAFTAPSITIPLARTDAASPAQSTGPRTVVAALSAQAPELFTHATASPTLTVPAPAHADAPSAETTVPSQHTAAPPEPQSTIPFAQPAVFHTQPTNTPYQPCLTRKNCSKRRKVFVPSIIITEEQDENDSTEMPVLNEREILRLCKLAKARKRNRIAFFNQDDGRRLRLQVKNHLHVKGKRDIYCALCGQNRDASFRGHRSGYKCGYCNVHLCINTPKGFDISCWDLWHNTRELRPRAPVKRDWPDTSDDKEDDRDEGVQKMEHLPKETGGCRSREKEAEKKRLKECRVVIE